MTAHPGIKSPCCKNVPSDRRGCNLDFHPGPKTAPADPRIQLVVLRQRIPSNCCGLDALLRNDARHGRAADLESPNLPEINAQNIFHDDIVCQ